MQACGISIALAMEMPQSCIKPSICCCRVCYIDSLTAELIVSCWHHMESKKLVNFGSCNGLLPDGTKQLPKPVMTDNQWGLVAFTWGQSCRKCSRNLSLILFGITDSSLQSNHPGANELMQDCASFSALAMNILQSSINTLRLRQDGRHFARQYFHMQFC